MKRISVDSFSTAIQLPSHTRSTGRKSNYASETEIDVKETPTQNNPQTKKPTSFGFPKCLFAECFPSPYISPKQHKTYRKLQYQSLDKKGFRKIEKTENERKTQSLKEYFLWFGKQKFPRELNGQIMKSVNQCVIADMVGSQKVQKCNILNMVKNPGRNSVMVSTMNSINGGYERHQSCSNSKLFLSSDCKINKILSFVQPLNRNQVDQINLESKKASDTFMATVREGRLSQKNNIKLKETEKTNDCQTMTNCLEIPSILCESIQINQQSLHQPSLFEFNHMKDSLIDKLNFFKKDESFIESKKKTFIRSKKNGTQESPRFCDFGPSFVKNVHKNNQNEQQFTDIEKVDSKQTIQQKILRKKFKTLDECGYTIVSKYNKSSDQKSILQESNIVFQASKMLADPNEQNINLPTFSDSQIVFNHEIKQNYENEKQYNSFINELNLDKQSDKKNPYGNSINKKVNRAFLRSKKSSSQKEIQPKDKDEMSIRFDLDTFIEYGPL